MPFFSTSKWAGTGGSPCCLFEKRFIGYEKLYVSFSTPAVRFGGAARRYGRQLLASRLLHGLRLEHQGNLSIVGMERRTFSIVAAVSAFLGGTTSSGQEPNRDRRSYMSLDTGRSKQPPDFDPVNFTVVPPRRFEDLRVGEVFRAPSRTLTDAHASSFQTVSADNHPIHYDVEYARRHGHTAHRSG